VEAHFSKRAHFGEPSARWSRLQALALGSALAPRPDAVDLTLTNPEGLGLVWPGARQVIARHAIASYVPEASGSLLARAAIRDSYAARASGAASRAAGGLLVDDILVTASTSESYSFLLHALCDPGDCVLVPRPSYPLLPDLARLADVRLVPYDLRYAGHFQLDPTSLPSLDEIRRERIRAVIVVSPNNPTGHFTSQGELELLASLGLPLIVDEVFRPFVHHARESAADPLSLGAPAFVLDGLSKRAALPGLKAGWIVITGNSSFREEARARLEAVADTFLSVSATAQHALGELLESEDELALPTRRRLAENLELLRTKTAGTALTLLEPDAGWSAILRLPALSSEERYFEDLAARGVWAHPGSLYDLPLAPAFVVSLLTPPSLLDQGLERIRALVAGA